MAILALALPLLVAGIVTDDAQDTAAADDLAFFTDFFHGRSDLHV
jgi:hypothetical protein